MAINKTELIITATDQTAGALNSVRNGIGSVQSAVAALGVSLSAGAFVGFIKSTIDAADSMNDLSARVGVGIKQLAGYKLAVDQSGSSIDAVAKGIKGLSTYFNEHSDRLKAAGITAKTADEAMVQLADTFAAMPDGMEKTALATQLFGKAGMDLIPMLNLGSAGLQEAKDKAAAYGDKLAEIAPNADKFNDNLAELKLQSSAAGISISNVLLPGLVGVTQWMNDYAAGGERAKNATEFLLENSPLARGLTKIRDLEVEIATLMGFMGGDKSKQTAVGLVTGGPGDLANQAAKKAADDAKKSSEDAALARAKLLTSNIESAKKTADAYTQLSQSVAAYQAQLDLQVDKQGKLTKADELSLQAKAKLSVAEQARLKPALDKLAADERELALQDALNKRYDDAIAAAEKETASIAEQVKAQQDHNDTIGLTTDQLGALEVARIDEQIAAKESLVAIFDETDGRSTQVEEIKNQIAALQELRSAKIDGAARQTVADEVKRTADEWKRFTDDIERGLTDALMRGFEGGKDGGRNFIDSIQNMLKTAAFKMVIQVIVSPVMGGVQSVLGGGSSGGGGISGGLQSWSGSSTGYGIANAGQWLSSGSTVGPAAPGSIGSLFSGAGKYANWQYGLAGLGGGLLGGAIGGSTGGTLGGIGSGIGMAMGGPVGGVIGSVAGGLLGSLFGGGGEDPHNNTDQSSVGFQLSKSGVAGFGTGYYADSTTGFNGMAPFSSTYGSTSGGSRWGDNVPLPQSTIDAINTAAAQLFASGASLATGLGLDSHLVDTASTASGTFASIDAALASLSDAIVTKVIPDIKDFQQANEALGDTASRLVDEYNLTNNIAKMRGQTGTQTFGSGLSGRDQLVQLLGGAGNAGSTIGSYYQNFYTEAERLKNTQDEIANSMKEMGITMAVTTREQFRNIVDSQDLTTESGRRMYASLISIADSFASITDASTIAKTSLDNFAQASAALADSSFSDLQNSISDQILSVQKEADARISANQIALNAMQSGLQAIQAEAQKIESARLGLSNEFAPIQQITRSMAVSQLRNSIASGDFTGAGDAASIAAQISSNDYTNSIDYQREQAQTLNLMTEAKRLSGEQVNYSEEAVRRINATIDSIRNASQAQIDQLNTSLNVAQSQLDALHGIDNGIKSLADAMAAFEASISIATAAKSPVPESIASQVSAQIAAQQALGVPMNSSVGVPSTSREASVAELFKSILGRDPAQSGLDYWSSTSLSISDIAKNIAASDEAKIRAQSIDLQNQYLQSVNSRLGVRTSIKAFAGGGIHAGGMRIVGENGPELEVTGPSRIYNSGQTKNIIGGNMARLESLVEGLTREVQALRKLNEQTVEHTKLTAKTLDFWNGDGMPATATV